MKSFTDQEYLELLQKLVDEQYDSAVDDYDINKMEWIPSEPEIKKKIQPNFSGIIDLTHVKSTKIKEEILKCANLRIGTFKIRINHYSGVPSQEGAKLSLSLDIMEERTRTPNGMPCRVDYRIDLSKDSRFKGRPWLKYFSTGGYASNVPMDTVIELVRWLQAIYKLTAFL